MNVYFKYSDNNWSSITTVTLVAVDDRKITSVKKENGQTIRGYNYSHKLFEKQKREIKISANYLYASTYRDILRAIWTAGALRYSNDNITYYDVVLDTDGDYPAEFIEDDQNFEEVTLNITFAEPS